MGTQFIKCTICFGAGTVSQWGNGPHPTTVTCSACGGVGGQNVFVADPVKRSGQPGGNTEFIEQSPQEPRTRTPEELEQDRKWRKHRFEDAIATYVTLAIFAGSIYLWVTEPGSRVMAWYIYFGLSVMIGLGINWLLRHPFRIVLVVLRNTLKWMLVLLLVGVTIWIAVRIFT